MRLWPQCRARGWIAVFDSDFDRCEKPLLHLDVHAGGGSTWGRSFLRKPRRIRVTERYGQPWWEEEP